MLVLGRVTVLVPWIHPWDLSESRSVALGFKYNIQTPSGLMPRGMYSEQYSAAPSGRGPKQRGRKSMIVSLGEMETQAGSLATRDGINLTRTVAKNWHVLFCTKWYTRSNWSCFSSLISLTFMAAYSPGNTTPPGQNNAVKHGDVSSEWLNRNVRLCETCSGSTSSHIA